MKISKKELKEIVEEELYGIVNEAPPKDAGEFGSRFPIKLSTVDPQSAKDNVTKGAKDFDGSQDDDIIKVDQSFSTPVENLKPSQSSMNIGKAMGMAIGMMMGSEAGGMDPGGQLGAFISEDNYIMDGHHRWIATAMVDPSKQIGGFKVDFPGAELIAVLNAMTAGQFGITKGKEGSGGFDQFEEGPIRKQLQTYAREGTPGKFGKGPEFVENAIEKFTGKTVEEGGIEATVEKMVNNLKSVKPFSLPAGAPDREDMPVLDTDINKDAYTATINALSAGDVDVNPPFHKDEDEALAESNNLLSISKKRLNEIIQEELQIYKRSK